MMCPDDGAVDPIGGAIALGHLRERFKHRVEHARLDPSSISPEDAVPLAIFIGQVPPLRACPGHPHHAFEIAPVILCRPASALRWQQRTNYRPFLIRHTNPRAQVRLQKTALNQRTRLTSSFVHDNLAEILPTQLVTAAAEVLR